MKLNLRLVTGAPVQELEIPSDVTTIGGLKQMISLRDDYELRTIKLCFKGSVLSDESKTFTDLNINDGDTVVVVGKRKVSSSGSGSAASHSTKTPTRNVSKNILEEDATANQTPAVPPAPPQTPQTVAPSDRQSVPQASEASSVPSNPPSTQEGLADHAFSSSVPTMTIGEYDEDTVQMIMGMGFDRRTVQRALRAAFQNAERAVEYCLTGIPPDLEADLNAASNLLTHAESTSGIPNAPQSGNAPRSGSDGVNPSSAPTSSDTDASRRLLELLDRSNSPEPSELARQLQELPNFDQIRLLILSNPETMLPMALQQLQTTNPTLASLITQNPGEFMQYLTTGLSGSGSRGDSSSQATGTSDDVPDGAVDASGRRVFRLGPQDMEPIQRLMALGGFSQEQAARAYLMAGRNEEYAAAVLFEAREQGYNENDMMDED